MSKIPQGVYPVMITPFTEENQIDWENVDRIVDFYIDRGCQGVFAVCQSSELFFLDEEERVELAKRVQKRAAGKLCVVASGHISDDLKDQIRELKRMSETGVSAVVMISNRLAREDEDDNALIRNMNTILEAVPGVTFGMYECPYPYKRLLSDEVLKSMAESGRFAFIKDTCCDADLIAHRVEVLKGRVQLFNANAATVLETMKVGADGFSGIMANYHPEFYVWMIENYKKNPEKCEQLSAFLSIMSGVERCQHPISAKYHMQLVGIPMTLKSRVCDCARFGKKEFHEIDDLYKMEHVIQKYIS